MTTKQSNQRAKVSLALFVYSRGVGIAVMEDAMTVINACNVVVHRYPIQNRDLLNKVKEKIDFYMPDVVILEDAKGYGSRKSKRVSKVIGLIEKYGLQKSLTIKKYSRNDIRYVFSSFGAHSKYQIAKVISQNVKQLPIKLPEKRKSHQPEHYSMTIFDAIALGITHYYQS